MTECSELELPLKSDELHLLLDLSAPYIGRLFAILRHSNIDLKILKNTHGIQIMKTLHKVLVYNICYKFFLIINIIHNVIVMVLPFEDYTMHWNLNYITEIWYKIVIH